MALSAGWYNMELMRMHYQETRAPEMLAAGMFGALTARCNPVTHTPAWLLIGSPLYPGDSLGPEVGDRLQAAGFAGVYLGTTSNPVDGATLYPQIYRICALSTDRNRHAFIIAVDAAVRSPGWIQLRHGPVRPGAGVRHYQTDPGPTLSPVGSLSLHVSTMAHPDQLSVHQHGFITALVDVTVRAIISTQEMWDEHVMSEYDLRVAATLAPPDR